MTTITPLSQVNEGKSERCKLVIAEKPDAALRIAEALGSTILKTELGIKYYEVPLAFDGAHYVVTSASGHLYGVASSERSRSIFPVYDIAWFPLGSIHSSSKSSFSRNRKRISRFYANVLSNRIVLVTRLALRAEVVIHACDYDLEGETIGSNLIRYACGTSTSYLRAKFSTLTVGDIRSAFQNLESLDEKLAASGRMRHLIDFLWGVNVSRALTESVGSVSKEFRLLTTGRVQGPTLAFVVKREIEIQSHLPMPLWEISCYFEKNKVDFIAHCEDSQITTRRRAFEVFEIISKEKTATVDSVSRTEKAEPTPHPFNLSTLQKEAFRLFRLSPSATSSSAEGLYLKALISYPRTESQKLPPSIGYLKILHGLSENEELSGLIGELLQETRNFLSPRQGPKSDPAHPSIYPTGERQSLVSNLSTVDAKIYDLIVRRFLSLFAKNAIFEETYVELDIGGFKFSSSGKKMISPGWMKYYPFMRTDQQELPDFAVSEKLAIRDSKLEEKYSRPPPQFTESSLLTKMESEGIGTKATRAETISALLSRKYLTGKQALEPTETGFNLVATMETNCPILISPEMTERVERQIDSISDGRNLDHNVLLESMRSLRPAIEQLQNNQRDIGHALLERSTLAQPREARKTTKIANDRIQIGPCPICSSGSLVIIRSYRTGKRFLGCSNYSKTNCRASAPLPRKGTIISGATKCNSCNWPEVTLTYYRKTGRSSPWKFCPNPSCPSKTAPNLRNHSFG